MRTERLAPVAFAVLVLATAGAFLAAQELKSTPPVVQAFKVRPFFSPNRDGRFDRARASFFLDRTDDVSVSIVGRDGGEVRRLVDNRRLVERRRLAVDWDGTDDAGRMVEDGTYRVRVNLRRQGRAVLLPRNIVKDTEPPELLVRSIGPEQDKVPRPELLPRADGRAAKVTFQAPGRRKEVLVYRTDVTPARAVFDDPIELSDDQDTWTWDATADGRRVAAGTYVVILRARDQAGNIATSAPVPPRPTFRQTFEGRGGITVRYLTAQSSNRPVVSGQQATVAVDSVGERFTWRLRRVGTPSPRVQGRGTRSRIVHFTAPKAKSGLFLFEVHTATRRAAAPLPVQAPRRSPVLVVLPSTTWQGANPRDDDGDGRVDTLGAGVPVRVDRPYVRTGLPAQLPRNEALLLAELDRQGRDYDITTDVDLARNGAAAQLARHRGVILAGTTRWLDGTLARRLRSYVRGGGRVLSVGTQSLRRSVRVTPGLRAIDPTPPTRRDLFGARIRPPARGPVTLTSVLDRAGLFEGTAGQFGPYTGYEQTASVGAGARLVASAATQDGERDVLVAARVGRGLVIRPGLEQFSARLSRDDELARVLARSWTLLRRP